MACPKSGVPTTHVLERVVREYLAGYSPNLVEGVFPEVHLQDSA